MNTPPHIRPARIRNAALTGHQRLAEAPSARPMALSPVRATARERRAARRPWFIVAFSAALLGVFAWAAPPEARGRLPDPARTPTTRPGQPVVAPPLVGVPTATPAPTVTAPGPMEIKVGGMKANPYPTAAAIARRTTPAKRAKAPTFGRLRKVDDIKDNPYR